MTMTAVRGWVPDPSRSFGARLALIRQNRKWNMAEAARECGINDATWTKWETVDALPRNYQAVCEQIADRSGCSAIWLMTGVTASVTDGSLTAADLFALAA